MKNEGYCVPAKDGSSFNVVGLLKSCTAEKDLLKGSKLHALIREHKLLRKNAYVGSTLVNMYAKCGALFKAQKVLKELPVRDVVTWNALIAGYAQQGQGESALKCFYDMLHEGHSPTAVTFASVLKACANIGAAAKGKEIHDKIISLGMLDENPMLGTSLVDMYMKCGALGKAQHVLEDLPVRDVVSWSALIAGYAQQGQGMEALKCFDDMLQEGHTPTAVTFASVLKACGSIRAAAKGKEIHDKVVRLGMLEKEVVLVNSLVDFYVKCGAMSKAHRLLQELPIRNVVTWNTLISGYAEQGQGEQALKCFDDMLQEGHSPTVVTLACVLKACGRIGAATHGQEIHHKIICLGMLEKDVVVGSTLVDMYVKCGALAEAEIVLAGLGVRDVISWSALIAGYAEQGQGEKVLKFFDDMLQEGHAPSAVTLACTLRGCGSIGATAKGKEIHDKVLSLGMLEKDAVLGTALVDMYVKFGALGKAQRVLEELPARDVVSWSALIAGYAQQGQGEEALKCFHDMLHEGHSPTAVTFACLLKAYGSIGAAAKGEEIHDMIDRLGMLEKENGLGNSLVDFYVKSGAVFKARQVLDELSSRNIITWNALIAGYAEQGQGEEALKCFDDMLCEGHSPTAVTFACVLKACGSIGATAKGQEIHDKVVNLGMLEKDIVLGNSLLDMYMKCGAVLKAQQVLKGLCIRDVVTWNALIAGSAEQGQEEEALKLFEDMVHEGHFPTAVSFVCILKACGSIGAAAKGEEIHAKIVSLGIMEEDIVLSSMLVSMYVNCGALTKAQQVLEELPIRDVVSWSSLIAGYAGHGQGGEALKWFDVMVSEGHSPTAVTFACALRACGSIGAAVKGEDLHDKVVSLGMLEKNSVLRTSLVDMYMKCGALAKGQRVLEELSIRDVASWSALIAGYAEQGHGKEALKCFDDMLQEGHSPDVVTFVSVLKACGSIGTVAKGKEIHDMIISLGMLEKNIVLETTLVDMYVRCGALVKAQQVFEGLSVRDVVSWSALIAGCAQHGQGEEALKHFSDMLREGHSPTSVTFVCVLKACGSIGATNKGKDIHDKIVSLGMLEKDIVLGNALVDMYMKCGAHVMAQQVLEKLPVHDVVSWSALIAGYAQHGQSVEAIYCFERMQSKGVKPNSVTLISLFNTCSHSGLLDQAEAYFAGMNTKYHIDPNVEHYSCMSDLFGRAGQFNKALSVIAEMPSDKCLLCWVALLDACCKWQDVKIGRLAFKRAVHLDTANAAIYVRMAAICGYCYTTGNENGKRGWQKPDREAAHSLCSYQ